MFYVPPTKKSFSLSALRCWGERLASEPNVLWETFLVNGFLEAGQALYRKISHPVEIFLEDNAAAVQFRTEEDGDIHIFFSADEKGWLHWRSSLPERESAAPFAGAAMYFIEEFVAEEFPRLPIESGTAAVPPPAPEPEPLPPPPEDDEGSERTLIPVFSAEATRLSCAAFWEIETSGERIPALGKNAPSPDSLRKKDREQLIRLATLARRAYFSYDSENVIFVYCGINKLCVLVYYGNVVTFLADNFHKSISNRTVTYKNYFHSISVLPPVAAQISIAEFTAKANSRTKSLDHF